MEIMLQQRDVETKLETVVRDKAAAQQKSKEVAITNQLRLYEQRYESMMA